MWDYIFKKFNGDNGMIIRSSATQECDNKCYIIQAWEVTLE